MFTRSAKTEIGENGSPIEGTLFAPRRPAPGTQAWEVASAWTLTIRRFGGYMLVYRERNAIAYGAAGHKGRGYGLTLDGVEAYLKRREKLEKKRGVIAGTGL